MTETLAVCGAGLCAFFAISIVRELKREYAQTLCVAFCVIFVAYAAPKVLEAVSFIEDAAAGANSGYVEVLLRALGITYLTSISADICRSSGEAAVAGYIESAGRVELLLLAIPLFSELLELSRF